MFYSIADEITNWKIASNWFAPWRSVENLPSSKITVKGKLAYVRPEYVDFRKGYLWWVLSKVMLLFLS